MLRIDLPEEIPPISEEVKVQRENERLEAQDRKRLYLEHRTNLKVLAGEKREVKSGEEQRWLVTVTTANEKGAGTDSRVMVTLCGTQVLHLHA